MGRPRCTLITPLVSSPKSGVYPHCGVPTTNFDCAHRRRPPVSLHARTLTHTPALKRPHPYSAAPRPVMVSPTPLSSNVARKIERSRRSRPKGATRAGRRANQPAPPSRGVVWPRGAPYGLRARPWRPWPHPVARPRPGDRVDRGTNSIRRRRARGRRSPALAPPVRGAPLQLPRVVDRRSSSRSELPSTSEVDPTPT